MTEFDPQQLPPKKRKKRKNENPHAILVSLLGRHVAMLDTCTK